MPGGEEDEPALGGEEGEVGELADGRRRRLLEHDVLAGGERLAGIEMADLRRRADRDRLELRHRGIHLGGCAERRHALDLDAALGRDGGEPECRVLRDHRKVLVLGDLAEADDADRGDGHGRFPF